MARRSDMGEMTNQVGMCTLHSVLFFLAICTFAIGNLVHFRTSPGLSRRTLRCKTESLPWGTWGPWRSCRDWLGVALNTIVVCQALTPAQNHKLGSWSVNSGCGLSAKMAPRRHGLEPDHRPRICPELPQPKLFISILARSSMASAHRRAVRRLFLSM